MPDGKTRTGIIHSHGAYDPDYLNNNFSPQDKAYTERRDVDIYLSTPSGTLQRYNVISDTENTLDTDIPFDPKDQDRQNNAIIPDKPR